MSRSSETTEVPQEEDHSKMQTTPSQSNAYEPSLAGTDSSFMPGQAAFSSTPAAARGSRTEESFGTQKSDDPSWMTSVESPLVRLDREFKEFSRESERDGSYAGSSTSRQLPSLRFDEPTPSAKQSSSDVLGKGKKKEAEQPLLRNVLRHNLHSMDHSSSTASVPNVSPLKFHRKPKTPLSTMKHYNPYLPPDTDPVNWSGVVDLRDPSVTTPQRRKGKAKSSRQTPASHAKVPDDEDDDDSFEGLPPGMSPPVLMSPARPPRSSAELGLLKVGQTPKTEVSERIKRDLLRDMQYSRGIESSMSTVPTPPSLSRYNRPGMDTTDSIVMDSSLESMFRRVGLNVPSKGSTPGLRLPARASQKAFVEPSEPPQQTLITFDEPLTPIPPQPEPQVDSDSDSLDEINNTAHPSAAFLMASAQCNRDSDDSFGSSNHSSDSLDGEDGNGLVPVHPFAQGIQENGYDDDDDSYDDDVDDMYDGGATEEETLFGVPPAQRLRAQSGMVGDNLRMLGEELIEDTIGMGSVMATRGRVEESPTPAPRN